MPLRLRDFGTFLAVGAAIAFFLVEHWGAINLQSDDAYISYRYAENLAQGHGLVFNPGERVEGFSNLSWVLLVAAGSKLGFQADAFGFYLALVVSSLLLLATFLYTRALLPSGWRWLASLSPLVLLSSNSFTMWSAAGLETPFYALITIGGFWAAYRNKRTLVTALCVLAILTRPDGLLLAAVLLGLPFLTALFVQRGKVLQWRYCNELIYFSLACLLLTAWRLHYFGEWLPNTFYAKVGGIPLRYGANYIWEFLFDGAIFFVLPFCIAPFYRPALFPALALVALVTIYCYLIGGDVFKMSRFFLPVLPLIISLSFVSMAELLATPKRLQAAICVASLVAGTFWSIYGPPTNKVFRTFLFDKITFPASAKRQFAMKRNPNPTEGVIERAEQLQQFTQKDDLIAIVAIGRWGYFLPNPILDLVGLTDKVISRSIAQANEGSLILPGHQRSNADYVLSRQPKIILIPEKGQGIFVVPAFKAIWKHPQLARDYVYDYEIRGYLRRDGSE